jgi:predicted NAD/FAD-binding protein
MVQQGFEHMKIAIIGSGIAGLGAAYTLHSRHEITVYEKNAYIGGHSRTIYARHAGRSVPVDTGFMAFTYRDAPYLTGLFEHLKVPIVRTGLSYGASVNEGQLEFNSEKIFSQKKNFFKPQFWGLVSAIRRFNKEALDGGIAPGITIEQLLSQLNFGEWFTRYYLEPLSMGIWGLPYAKIRKMPAETFCSLFRNHALLLNEITSPWCTIKGGCREYISRLIEPFSGSIRTECGVKKVRRENGKVFITDQKGATEEFDQVVFACNADQALELLETPTEDETALLGSFTYAENEVVLHKDTSFLPKERDSWRSWNYLEVYVDGQESRTLTLWMDRIQRLEVETPLLLSINPDRKPSAIHDRFTFRNLLPTQKGQQAQQGLAKLQGIQNSWYCGGYHHNGTAEDGLSSAVKVCSQIGVPALWKQSKG